MPLVSRRLKATPTQIGCALYGIACDGVQKLTNELVSTPLFRKLSEEAQPFPQFAIEVMFFCMFPFDLALHRNFGSHGREIGNAFRHEAFLHYHGNGGENTQNFHNRLEARFLEYALLLQNPDGDQAVAQLASRGMLRIFGEATGDPQATTICRTYFTETIKNLATIISHYEVI